MNTTIYQAIGYTVKGGARVAQTMRILCKSGLGWVFGDRPPAPKLMRKTFEKLGATYIKLGQFIASSPSLFPAEYVEEFQYCLDKTDPLPFKKIEPILKKELGQPLSTLFSEIDPIPIASASIAQVYGAKLVTGEDVVIKVQKPRVQDILLTDLNFLFICAKIMEWLIPNLWRTSLSAIISEIQSTMMDECDFYKEASNIEKFNQFLIETDNSDVVVPKVYSHASTLRVLTMERLYGVPLTDLESIQKYSKDPRETLLTAMNTWFASLMLCEFFHADVHAGNLMVLQDGRVGFIDFGIVGRIQAQTWMAMAAFMEGMSVADYHQMATSMVKIGITDKTIDIDGLAADLEKLYHRLNELPMDPLAMLEVDEEEITKTMIAIFDLGKNYGIRFPREFAMLLKQFLYFDRYNRILSPDLNIFKDERLVFLAD
ncbi:MAG: AarF/ABC1/UbiB kinase family protein [Desulfobacterales bacterium]|nr:AarF/ABC1/UbiB kinase family protein [Desulfobacterales bacterium]